MSYAEHLRGLFPTLELEVADLFALETVQLAALPSRAPAAPLAEVLHAHPEVRTFMEVRHPPIAAYLAQLLAEHEPADTADLASSEQQLLWEIGDQLVYVTAPEVYDALPLNAWDFEVVAGLVNLEAKVVIDAGAGTGKVAFAAARRSGQVFAVEPIARLREFMRAKARASDMTDLFVLDGTLDAIPLPADTADVLLTCRAIGWHLERELVEVERVVRDGGVVLHLGFQEPPAEDDHVARRLIEAGYTVETYLEGQAERRCYRKRLAPGPRPR